MRNGMIQTDWLRNWAIYTPNKVALIEAETEKQVSYEDLFKQSCALALKLQTEFNIEKGDRVAVISQNDVRYVPLFFAVQRLGAILVPLNFRLSPREIEFMLEDSGAKLVICNEDYQSLIKDSELEFTSVDFSSIHENLAEIDPEKEETFKGEFTDPLMILYTSGTTGRPKGAVLTHEMIFWNSVNTGLRLNLTTNDTQLCFLPFFHTGGWNVLLMPTLHRGGQNIIMKKFDAERILELSEKYKTTVLFGVPTTLEMMSQSEKFEASDLSTVRYAIVGGEPMPIELIKTWQKKGIAIRQGYGLTEFGPNVFSLNEEDSLRKIGSIGFPNFYIETRVVNQHGELCGPDEVGELLLKGPVCMKEYWNNPQATKETIKAGWLHTGDLVKFDSEKYFYVVGRKKEMFISGGENVYPVEVEQVLSEHPDISEVAVLGTKDSKWGEVGKAFIKAKSPIQPKEIEEFCKDRLAKFKIPKHFVFLDDLPKGHTGKILKRQLSETSQ